MSIRAVLLVMILPVFCPVLARGQAFFAPGVSSFTPEIDVVSSGVVNDVQATVSYDRKYVTLTMRPQQSQLLNLSRFTFQSPQAAGFVGGVQFNGNLPAAGRFGAVNTPVALAPGRGAALLVQRGMTRILAP